MFSLDLVIIDSVNLSFGSAGHMVQLTRLCIIYIYNYIYIHLHIYHVLFWTSLSIGPDFWVLKFFIPTELHWQGGQPQESVSAVVAGIEGSSEEDAQEWLQAGALMFR